MSILGGVICVVWGVLLGVGWAETEIVRERIRASWRRGYQSGRETFVGAEVTFFDREKHETYQGIVNRIVPAHETDAEAAARLIRETSSLGNHD